MALAGWWPTSITTSLLLSVLLIFVLFRLYRFGHRSDTLPPGPSTTFILGNLHQYPQSFPQLQFFKWMQEFGEIFTASRSIFSATLKINCPAAIKDILDVRGTVTGGRPRTHLQRATRGLHLVLESLENPVWKRSRKAVTRFLTEENLSVYMATQKVEYVQMLNDVLTRPDEIYNHIRRTSVSIMTTLVYGKKCLTYKDSTIEEYFEGIRLFNEANNPRAHPPIEIFPWVAHIPGWLAPWTKHLERTARVRDSLYYGLFAELEEKKKLGKAKPCYLGFVLDNQAKFQLPYDEVAYLGTVLMDGGAETVSTYLHSFVLAILSFPDAQKKAQDEIDKIIGNNRLPALEDFNNLPYLRALIDEVIRYRPILPITLPRIATMDLAYQSYVLPKGSMLVLNAWGIFHNPELYEDPDAFRPERYLESEHGTKPGVDTKFFRDNFLFGAGRVSVVCHTLGWDSADELLERICPGEKMARRTIAMNTMNLLWAFSFSAKEGESSSTDMSSYSMVCLIPECSFGTRLINV
ncbi:MAG: hypothetical protein Q9202_003979 [Teloschistes flavicans]